MSVLYFSKYVLKLLADVSLGIYSHMTTITFIPNVNQVLIKKTGWYSRKGTARIE